MKKFYHSFLIAFSMYSKIPMPQCEWNEENMAYAMCFFPWIGVAIGGVTWLWGTFGTYLGLSSAFYTVILTLIPWFLTGGIHLDGLLDTADAMSSWQERRGPSAAGERRHSHGRLYGHAGRHGLLATAGKAAGDPEGFEFRSICGDYLCGLLYVLLWCIQPDQCPCPGDDPLYILSVPDIKRAGDRDISEGKKDRIGFCYGTRGEG